MKNLDVRAQYTRRVIEEQFLSLLGEKPYTKITVTELCQRAHLNRATFYKHYEDVPDLLEKTEERLLDGLREVLERHTPGGLYELVLCVARYMKESGERYIALGSGNGDPELAVRSFELCRERAYPLLVSNLPGIGEDRRELLYRFLSQGSGGVLTAWLRSGMKQPPEELAGFLVGVCSSAATGLENSRAQG